MGNIISICVGIAGFIVGVAGLIYAVWERRQSRSIRWADLASATKDMALHIKSKYSPQLFYAPTQKSGVLLELMQPYFSQYTPIIFGMGVPKAIYKEKPCGTIINQDAYYCFETSKWFSFVPKSIRAYSGCQLIVVDDFAMSGEYLAALKECLITQAGFSADDIKTVCLANTSVSEHDSRAPDYVWKTVDSAYIYLPWGRPQ